MVVGELLATIKSFLNHKTCDLHHLLSEDLTLLGLLIIVSPVTQILRKCALSTAGYIEAQGRLRQVTVG